MKYGMDYTSFEKTFRNGNFSDNDCRLPDWKQALPDKEFRMNTQINGNREKNKKGFLDYLFRTVFLL